LGKGNELAKLVGIEVKQSLYSEWGNFYAPIKAFPCALFDKNGFIILNNESDLSAFKIRVGKRVNVPERISSLPIYKKINDYVISIPNEVIEEVFVEGALTQIQVNSYERDLKARQACLAHYGYTCAACEILLSDIYGEIADRFIHVHHIKPISEIKQRYQVDPIKDLRPVCPNCHAIIHLRKPPKPPLTVDEVKALLNKNC
jgi:predicted HNH restriction endonuclease